MKTIMKKINNLIFLYNNFFGFFGFKIFYPDLFFTDFKMSHKIN